MVTRRPHYVVFGLLLLVVALKLTDVLQVMPRSSRAVAPGEPAEISISGIVFDFRSDHSDFDVVPAGGFGHYAGNIAATLNGTPEFIGLGAEDFTNPPPPVPTFEGPWGYEAEFSNTIDEHKEKQVAVQADLIAPVFVNSISAYVGNDDDKTRYAIYRDNGGEPGELVVQTGVMESADDTMEWLTIPVPDTYLQAGTYWLALSFKDEEQEYAYTNSGGNTRVRVHKAVDDGFITDWGASESSSARRISIYATTTSASNVTLVGETSALSTVKDGIKELQIATPIVMPEEGTILSISAYVGGDDQLARYALYSDAGGTPGALLAETAAEETMKNGMGWLTMYIDDTDVSPGTYWIAMSLENDGQEITVEPAGGTTHYVARKAVDDGFLTNWGSSMSTTSERIAMHATYTTDAAQITHPGYRVDSEWTDASGRPISPQMEGLGADGTIDFEIVDNTVIPDEQFAIEVRVLGGAIQSGSSGYHIPVTMQVDVSASTYQPFGPYDDAVFGNLNDDQNVTCNSNGPNPRCSVISGPFPPGTSVDVDCRSWTLDGGDPCVPTSWSVRMQASTDDDDDQVLVLRDGDPVPQIPALYNQSSIADYVEDYIDVGTNTMSLGVNQIIYLFEVGMSGGSSSADFQDLVVLITLASDTAGLCGGGGPGMSGTTLCGSPFGDTPGSATPAGTIDVSGGITSAASFAEWYTAVPGVNLGMMRTITLVRNGLGVYEFITPDFHPIDGDGFGNLGDAHNYFFTYKFQADFAYQSCGGQFIEFDGSDDAWLFVNKKLVMDRGGIMPSESQYVEMDRLGLADGEIVTVDFFFAQRLDADSTFSLRTNIPLATKGMVTVSGSFD